MCKTIKQRVVSQLNILVNSFVYCKCCYRMYKHSRDKVASTNLRDSSTCSKSLIIQSDNSANTATSIQTCYVSMARLGYAMLLSKCKGRKHKMQNASLKIVAVAFAVDLTTTTKTKTSKRKMLSMLCLFFLIS